MLVVVAVFMVVWDVVMGSIDPTATISVVLRNACKENIVITFVIGFLLGHCLWPLR